MILFVQPGSRAIHRSSRYAGPLTAAFALAPERQHAVAERRRRLQVRIERERLIDRFGGAADVSTIE